MRASGILLPVSSLPSKYGIGCFSEEAYEDMEIHHTSLFLPLREIRILLIWRLL